MSTTNILDAKCNGPMRTFAIAQHFLREENSTLILKFKCFKNVFLTKQTLIENNYFNCFLTIALNFNPL